MCKKKRKKFIIFLIFFNLKKKSIMNFSESRQNRSRENREKSKNRFFSPTPACTHSHTHTHTHIPKEQSARLAPLRAYRGDTSAPEVNAYSKHLMQAPTRVERETLAPLLVWWGENEKKA